MHFQLHSWTHQEERWQGYSSLRQTRPVLPRQRCPGRGRSSVGRPTKMTRNPRCFYAVRSPIPSERRAYKSSSIHILLPLLPTLLFEIRLSYEKWINSRVHPVVVFLGVTSCNGIEEVKVLWMYLCVLNVERLNKKNSRENSHPHFAKLELAACICVINQV